jgi:hypothetical protein
MSYEEKRIWVYLVTSTGAYAVYLAIVFERALRTPVAQVPYVSALLWTTGASIAASMVGRTLVETARPSDSRRSDVRDREISRFGEYAIRHGDRALGLLLDRQRHLSGVRPVGGRGIRGEARRLPAGSVARWP